MGILDGFMFWIGKALAELAVFLVFAIVVFFVILWLEYKEQKRKDAHENRLR